MSFKNVTLTLAADLVASGTLTVAYPTGTDFGNFTGSFGHKLSAIGGTYNSPSDFTLTFNAGDITLTWGAGKTTIPAGATVWLTIEQKGENDGRPFDISSINNTVFAPLVRIDLSSPTTLDADGLIVAATGAELPNAETVTYTPATDGTSPTDGAGDYVTINGTRYWVLDVPRNVTGVMTHGSSVVASSMVVTGLDEYGVTMSELFTFTATGTSKAVAGKKAFKHVASIAITAAGNAEANTLNAGWGDVLGLPVAVPVVGYVLKELEDDVAPSAGTFVGAVRAAATTSTGDVRGTYDPATACDGAKGFALVVALTDPTDLGVTQA